MHIHEGSKNYRSPQRSVVLVAFVGLLLPTILAGPVNGASSGGSTDSLLPADPGSEQDPAFVAAKNAGRVVKQADGTFAIASVAPLAPTAMASSASLTVGWTGEVWEPKGSGGSDDHGHAYTDLNYWNFCAPGAATVASYYFSRSYPWVTGIGGASYTEPRNNGHQATTYWTATDSVSAGRGALMYFAEYEKPPVTYTWQYRGMVDWSKAYPAGTPTNRLRDGLNWEASGRTTVNYFYVQVAPSGLTKTTLLDKVESDIGQGVPTIANVRTGNGSVRLANWTKTGGVNHSITIVGYNNTSATYTYIDSCGPGCNTTGKAAGVYSVSQSTMWTLLGAETDHDGILW